MKRKSAKRIASKMKRKPVRRIPVTRSVATTTRLPEYECRHCGHEWIPRTNIPRECPNCKSRNWLTSKK